MAKGKKTGGRVAGTPNRLSGLAKDNIATVFDHVGGIVNMVEWAKENQTEFYKMYAKLIPVQVEGSGDDGDINVTIKHIVVNAED